MIKIKDLTFSYLPDQKLLSGISFSVKKGEFVALLGANGTGKSTLLKLILAKLTPQKGSITINGKNVQKKKSWLDVGYVPQKISIDSNHPAKVSELIFDLKLCTHLNIETLMNKQFKNLSGGQQQRVLVGLALQNDPELLLLDEPTVGIDEETRKGFYTLLKHLAKDHNKTIILVTHDNELVKKYTNIMYCIDNQHHFTDARCCLHD